MRKIGTNGYFVIPALSAIYVIGAIYYLSTLYGPLVTVDIADAPTIFLSTGLFVILSLPYMFCLWMLNERLVRPVPEWVVAVLAGVVLLILYLFHQWSKHQLGVT